MNPICVYTRYIFTRVYLAILAKTTDMYFPNDRDTEQRY